MISLPFTFVFPVVVAVFIDVDVGIGVVSVVEVFLMYNRYLVKNINDLIFLHLFGLIVAI